MTSTLNVRRATLADAFQLFSLVSSFPAPTSPSQDTFAQSLERRLQDGDSLVAVAEVADTLVGYISGDAHEAFYAGGKVAWVDEIYVQDEARREGIGRALMVEFESWAEDSHCVLIGLATRGAGSFYKALGYEESAGYFKRYLRLEQKPQER